MPAAYATDDGAGVLYRGTEFAETVIEKDAAGAYFVDPMDGVAVEPHSTYVGSEYAAR